MPTRMYVEQRTDYQKGRSFGSGGAYEQIVARAVTDTGEGRLTVLKPRDPVKGNGTVLFALNPKRRPQRSEDLLSSGVIIAELEWKDRAKALQGAHDLLNFLKVTGGPMLLGDQPRFFKRVLAVEPESWLKDFEQRGLNKGAKDRTLIDGEWPKDAVK